MTDQASTWEEVRRIADDLELKIHLAGLDARVRWRAIQPRIAEIETALTRAGQHASDTVERELASVGAALRRLRDDIVR